MESTKEKVSLEIIFVKNENIFTHFEVLGDSYEIPETLHKKIAIKDDKFLFGKDVLTCEFRLYHKDNSNSKISCIFNLYYGENIAYCFLNKQGFNFELLFLFPDTQNLSIKWGNDNISKCDDFETQERKRFLLINFPLDVISINNKYFNLKEKIPKNSKTNSFQYSFYEIETELAPLKEISLNKEIISIEEKLNTYKDKLKKFYCDLKEFYSSDISKYAHIEKFVFLLNNYKCLDSFSIDFINYDTNYLKKTFTKNEDIECFYYKGLYEFIKNKKYKICKNRKYFKKALSYIESYKETLIKKDELSIYHKILILKNFFFVFQLAKGIEGFKNINFNYYILEKSKADSVFKLTINFIKSFINKLNIKSKLFFPILQINSGIGVYNNQYVYTFNMMNLEMIKNHLNDIIPEILFFYSKKDNNEAYTNPLDGCITINKKNVFPKDNIDNFQNSLNQENLLKGKDNSIKLFRILFHEMIGHKKFYYKNLSGKISPLKSNTRKNKKITLVYRYKDENNENSWKILPYSRPFKGDHGNYLEACLGKIEDEFTIHLFKKTSNLGKLLDNVDFFVDQDLEKLKEYIKYKYLISSNNIKEEEKEDLTIEQEISFYKNSNKIKNVLLNKKRMIKKEDENEKKIFKKKKQSEIKFQELSHEDEQTEEIKNKSKYKKSDKEDIKSSEENEEEEEKRGDNNNEEANINKKKEGNNNEIAKEEEGESNDNNNKVGDSDEDEEEEDEEDNEEEDEDIDNINLSEEEAEKIRNILYNYNYSEIGNIINYEKCQKNELKLYKIAFNSYKFKY